MTSEQTAATARRIAQAIVEAGHNPWQLNAACASTPELVVSPTPNRVWDGLQLCSACPVVRQCAEWADQEPEYRGISAGAVLGRLSRRRTAC